MSYDDSQIYILQMLYGILPKELWIHNKEGVKDPFDGYSESQKRIIKRKFRKLKRKAGVRSSDSLKIAWNKINKYLSEQRFASIS